MASSRITPPPPPRWWVTSNGKTEGPFGEAYISACAANGRLPAATLLCLEGTSQWSPITNWPQFSGFVASPVMAEVAPFVPPVITLPTVAVDTRKYATGGLPGNVQWACTYGRFVSPAIYVLYFFVCIVISPATPNGFQGHMTDLFVQFLLRLVMFTGAGMLPRQHRNGAGTMQTCGLLLLGWFLISFLLSLSQPDVQGHAGAEGEEMPPEVAVALLAICFTLPIALGEIGYLIYMAIVLNGFRKNYWRSGR